MFSRIGLAIACAVVLVTIVGCSFLARMIHDDIKQASYDALYYVSDESAKAAQEVLKSRISFLNSIWLSLRASAPEERPAMIGRQQERSLLYNFDWIGCVGADGKGVKSIGGSIDLSGGSLFETNMQGDIALGQKLVTYPDGSMRDSILLSIPLFADEGKPVGSLYQLFSPNVFSDLLETNAIDGQVHTCLINSSGDILSATQDCVFSVGDNLIERLDGENNRAYRQAMSEAFVSPRGGGGLLHLDGTSWYNYYTPIALESQGSTISLGILSIVPQSYLDQQIEGSFSNVILLALLAIATLIIIASYIVWAQKRTQKNLEKIAYEDALTGGANYEALKRDLVTHGKTGGVLIFCDIVDFKMINRLWSSAKGDETLRTLGALFARSDGSDKLVAHMEDDNFALFYPNMSTAQAMKKCRELKESAIEALSDIGITHCDLAFGFCSTDGTDEPEHLRSRAMFAKSLGKKNRSLLCAYDEKVATLYEENVLLVNRFESALADGHLEVWFQPKVLTASEKVGGAEALVRWRDRKGGFISPGRFIPLLEEKSKIALLDEYMFTQVCVYQGHRVREGLPCVPISVNVTRNSLMDSELAQKYRSILDASGANEDLVYLEITEDTVMNATFGPIKSLRQAGFRLLMDDFGKGSSNLANLRKDLFSTVKLDKSLIDLIGTQEVEQAVLHQTIQMVHGIGLSIVAEGVETSEQVAFLARQGCEEIQGFFFYRPMDEASFSRLLEQDPEEQAE